MTNFRLGQRVRDAVIGIPATVIYKSQNFLVIREHTEKQTKVQYRIGEYKFLRKIK